MALDKTKVVYQIYPKSYKDTTGNGIGDYRFNYSIDGKVFMNLGGTVSGDILSTNEAGGFTGAMIGLYATSVGN